MIDRNKATNIKTKKNKEKKRNPLSWSTHCNNNKNELESVCDHDCARAVIYISTEA